MRYWHRRFGSGLQVQSVSAYEEATDFFNCVHGWDSYRAGLARHRGHGSLCSIAGEQGFWEASFRCQRGCAIRRTPGQKWIRSQLFHFAILLPSVAEKMGLHGRTRGVQPNERDDPGADGCARSGYVQPVAAIGPGLRRIFCRVRQLAPIYVHGGFDVRGCGPVPLALRSLGIIHELSNALSEVPLVMVWVAVA